MLKSQPELPPPLAASLRTSLGNLIGKDTLQRLTQIAQPEAILDETSPETVSPPMPHAGVGTRSSNSQAA